IPGPRIAEAKPEWEIPALIGRRLRPDHPALFAHRDTAEIRREMASLMPLYAGIDKLEKEGDSVQWGGPRLGADGFPNMPDRRARSWVCPRPRVDVPAGNLMLTARRGKQFNSITYGKKDPLTAGARRDDVLMSPGDMRRLGIDDGARVRLRSETGTLEAVARP